MEAEPKPVDAMTKYESTVKHIAAPTGNVYARLADLTHLESVLEAARQSEYADKIPKDIALTPDTLSATAPMLGLVTLRIVEREPWKTIKFALEGVPMQANVWVQLLPEGDGTAMKLTLGAELNFIMRQMMGKKLKEAVERIADTMAMIPY